MSKSNIKVALGTSSLISPLTGIGNYTLNIAKELAGRDDVNIECFYGHKWSNKIETINIPKANALKKMVRKILPQAYKARRIVQQISFNAGMKNAEFDVYHEPNFIPFEFSGPRVITVHDLSYLRFPHAHPEDRVRMMTEMLPPAIEHSQCIIADSYFTKMEILSEFGVADEKVHVTHLGKSASFYPRDKLSVSKILEKYSLTMGRYVIAVGTLEPRKNLIQAIQAYQTLPDKLAKEFPLVIVGMRGWKEKGLVSDLDNLISQGKAKMLGYVPSDELPYLYSGARSLVFPSLYEGFGLPVLEAMACGAPIIASNSSSIPEVVGEAGLLVDVGDVDTMASSILTLCEDDSEFLRLSEQGLIQADKFSWEQCAKDTYSAYQYALKQ